MDPMSAIILITAAWATIGGGARDLAAIAKGQTPPSHAQRMGKVELERDRLKAAQAGGGAAPRGAKPAIAGAPTMEARRIRAKDVARHRWEDFLEELDERMAERHTTKPHRKSRRQARYRRWRAQAARGYRAARQTVPGWLQRRGAETDLDTRDPGDLVEDRPSPPEDAGQPPPDPETTPHSGEAHTPPPGSSHDTPGDGAQVIPMRRPTSGTTQENQEGEDHMSEQTTGEVSGLNEALNFVRRMEESMTRAGQVFEDNAQALASYKLPQGIIGDITTAHSATEEVNQALTRARSALEKQQEVAEAVANAGGSRHVAQDTSFYDDE